MLDAAPIEIDGERYEFVEEGVDGQQGREGNKISKGKRVSDNKVVVLRQIREEISARTLAQINTAIRVRTALNGAIDPTTASEFLCGERRPGQWCATTFIPGTTLHQIGISRNAMHFIPSSVRIETALKDIIEILTTTTGWPANLIHRDLKPENIVVTPKGRYGIIDWEFGITVEELARMAEEEEDEREKRAPGTPQYMAPEAAARAEWTPESDDFSVGVMAIETLGLRIHPKNPTDILLEKADGTYRQKLLEGLAQFEERAKAEALRKGNTFDNHQWGTLRTWALLVMEQRPQKRPKRAEALKFLTDRGNITEI